MNTTRFEAEPQADPSQHWRLFIACPLPETLQSAVTQWRQIAQRHLLEGLRWSPPQQWHLTLRFLGDVPAADLPLLVEALEAACAAQPSFVLSLAGCGCFPSAERPRVFWLGLRGQVDALERLQARVAKETAPWGQKDDRPFRPHLTLARIRDGSPAAHQGLSRCLSRLPRPPEDPWTVDGLILYRSQLRTDGAVHTALHRCPLRS